MNRIIYSNQNKNQNKLIFNHRFEINYYQKHSKQLYWQNKARSLFLSVCTFILVFIQFFALKPENLSETKMAQSSDGDLFKGDLEALELQIPGGQKVSFRDDAEVLKVFQNHHPNWGKEGCTSSVPIDNPNPSPKTPPRITNSKGQGAFGVYKLFLKSADKNQKGLMLFPNLNSRKLGVFENADFQIDLVIAHPTKGIFVFTTSSEKNKNAEILLDKNNRNCEFMKMLIDYGHDKLEGSVPIQSVICLLHDDKIQNFASISTELGGNQPWILRKNELMHENFVSEWNQKMTHHPDLSDKYRFDVFVARLFVLNKYGAFSAFSRELDTFELQMPGAHRVPFRDNENLIKMLRLQYPNWEKVGNISSVPIARVPRLFLNNIQMSKKLQDEFKYLLKGEVGEIKVYRLLLDAVDPNEKGVMVFPNVNPQEVFKTESAQVEIDTVLAHPTKGFFVFNVKNQGEKLTPQNIQNDIERHANFIRMLLQYGQEKVDPIPIHSVICLLHDDNKKKIDSIAKSDGKDNRTFILSKSELTVDSFAKQWNQNLAEISNFNLNDKHFFDVAVARLVALSSLESSAALIHEQLILNDMQATNKSKGQFSKKASQFKDFDQDTKSILESTSKIKMASTKRETREKRKSAFHNVDRRAVEYNSQSDETSA